MVLVHKYCTVSEVLDSGSSLFGSSPLQYSQQQKDYRNCDEDVSRTACTERSNLDASAMWGVASGFGLFYRTCGQQRQALALNDHHQNHSLKQHTHVLLRLPYTPSRAPRSQEQGGCWHPASGARRSNVEEERP